MHTHFRSDGCRPYQDSAEHDDFPEGSPKFETDMNTALAKAKTASKPVIAVFSAVWCPPCQRMKHDVYPNDAVKAYHDKFVWVYLDTDASANEKWMEKYGVSSIPHIEFLDSSGKSTGNEVGFKTPEAFAKVLDEKIQKAGQGTTSTAATAK
ncbi:thioredoxin family protein [Prosthecobacter sp.]|uniref:thioredoxin family protein n=1 Tax=Prosthecobacter sp. TaxID=1965333 RepID=UPI0026315A02|nr:thioredoxin family protein [Prosthecobacter sp.]